MAQTDQYFKDVLRTFLPDFMRVFFPAEAARLDFSTVRFCDKELFTGWPAGRRREVDLLAEVATLEGVKELIYLHIEVQARKQVEFDQRMWEYYLVLRPLLQRPVLPIALSLARNSGGLTSRTYVDTVLSHPINQFQYLVVGVRDLNEVEYRSSEIPLAHAFRSLMRTLAPRDELALDCLRRLQTSSLEGEQKYLLGTMAEKFAPMSLQERGRLEQRLQQEEPEMRQWMMTEAETMVRDARRRDLQIFLEGRFGELPPKVLAALDRLRTSQLDALIRRSGRAASLDELGLGNE